MKQLNCKGIALITVMIAFLTLFILLGMIAMMTLSNQSTSIKTNDYTKAYYIAESGLNIRVQAIKDEFYALAASNIDPNDLIIQLEEKIRSMPSNITFIETTDDDQATLSFEAIDGNLLYPKHIFYKLTSIGTVNGTSQTIHKELGFSYTKGGKGLIIGKAVLTQRDINIGLQGSQVIGPVASNLLDGSTINFNGTTQTGIPEIFVPTGRSSSVININNVGSRITENTEPYVFPIINYPILPSTTPKTVPAYTFLNNEATINVFEYSYLEYLTVADGQTLIIDLGARGTSISQKILKVKRIDINGNLRVIGTGRLLLVYDYGDPFSTAVWRDKATICANVIGTCQTSNPDYTKFLLYLKTSNPSNISPAPIYTLEFANQNVFYGSILAENVNIAIKVNSGVFKGHIVTGGKKIDFTSNAEIQRVLFYAPFADITISSNANLSGSLVANRFSIANPQSKVTYSEVDKEYFPFTIDFPTTEEAEYVNGTAEVIEGSIIAQ